MAAYPSEVEGQGLVAEGDVVRVAAEEELDERRSLPGSPKWTTKMSRGAPNGRYAKKVHQTNVMNLFGMVHRVNKEGTSLMEWEVSNKRDAHDLRLADESPRGSWVEAMLPTMLCGSPRHSLQDG